MTEGRVKNVAASVRARLLRKMPELGEAQFQRLLRRFAIERFLYRLGRSPDRERFVLKGAMLLVLFGGKLARPTKDLDPPPRIRAYQRETVIAEKTEALVKLGAPNSRMKDFFDLWAMAGAKGLDGQELVPALRKTFERRGTALPDGEPAGLQPAFFLDPVHIVQWQSFVRDRLLEDIAPDLPTVGEGLRVFLMPLLRAAATVGGEENSRQLAAGRGLAGASSEGLMRFLARLAQEVASRGSEGESRALPRAQSGPALPVPARARRRVDWTAGQAPDRRAYGWQCSRT